MTVRPLRSVEVTRSSLRVISGRRLSFTSAFGWVLYTAAVVAAFLALFFLRGAADESAFEIRQMHRRIEVEMDRQHRLQLEKTRLESPGEIIPIAEGMLGMVLPEDVVPVAAPRRQAAVNDVGGASERPPGEVSRSNAGREAAVPGRVE